MKNNIVAASGKAPPECYEIRIAGILDPLWHDWLNGMNVTYCDAELPQAQTIISIQLPDQAALHGILTQLRDQNLRLISVNPQETKGDNA